jgi:hypothetical protein
MMRYKHITKGSQGKEHNGFNPSTSLGQLERCSKHKDQFQVKSLSRAVTDWGQFRDKLGQCKGTFRHKLTRVAPTREVLLRLTFLLTSLDPFYTKIIFTFFIKQATLMRSSTVLSLPSQLVFPASTFGHSSNSI